MYNNVPAQINLLSVTLVAQAICHDQQYRPIDLAYDDSLENELVAATDGFNAVSRSGINKVAGKMLSQTIDSKGTVIIEGGWQERRYSATMIIEVVRGSHISREKLCGFTNYAGVSMQGNIDHRMTLTINEHTVIGVERFNTGAGMGTRIRQSDTIKHICEANIDTGHGSIAKTTESMRPEDALAMASRAHAISPGMEASDSRTRIGGDGNETSNLNMVGSNWLHELLNGVTKTMSEDNLWAGNDGTIASEARNEIISGQQGSQSTFMQTARDVTGLIEYGCITFGELITLFPNLDAATNVVDMGVAVDMRDRSERMTAATRQNLLATQLGSIIPGLLNRFSIAEVTLCITNQIALSMDGAGMAECIIGGARAHQGAEQSLRMNTQALSQVVKTDIIPVLFPYDDCDYNIECTVRGGGGTDVLVSINGEQQIPFHIANYADGITGALAATNRNQADALASGVIRAIGSVKQRSVGYF